MSQEVKIINFLSVLSGAMLCSIHCYTCWTVT